jgi:hypothetical protein
LAALYLGAAIVRFRFLNAHFWIDESAVFYNAATGGRSTSNVFFEDSSMPALLSTNWLFWQRPLHALLMAPAAMLGEVAFRTFHILIAASLPVVFVILLRQLGVRAGLAYAAGAIVTLVPAFVVYGVYAFPDTPMLVALVCGLVLRNWGREGIGGLLVVAAVGIKEFAYIALLALLAPTLLRMVRQWTRPGGLQIDRFEAMLLAGACIGLWPLLYALSLGAQFPGWYRGGSYAEILDRSLLLIWFLPLVLLAAWSARRRAYAFLALAYPVFFLAFHASGRGVPLSYFMISGLFGLLVAVLVMEDLWQKTAGSTVGRRALVGGVAFLAAACLCLVVLPYSHPAKQPLTSPVSAALRTSPVLGVSDWSLPEWSRYLDTYRDAYWEGIEFVADSDWDTVFLVDGNWHDQYYPLPQRVPTVRLGFTDKLGVETDYVDRFSRVLENMTDVGLILKTDSKGNQAVRNAYSDCIVFENAEVAVIEGPRCAGRSQRLGEELGATHSGL